MRTTYVRSCVALLAAILLLGIATPAVAGNVDKPRPFHGIYVDPGVPVVTTIACEEGIPSGGEGTGHANHLGDYTWHAEFCLVPVAIDRVIVNVGWVTAVAANGDLLHGTMEVEGQILPDGSIVSTQHMTYEGGTGRFERALGSADAVGVLNPDGFSYNTFDGVLAFDASDRSR